MGVQLPEHLTGLVGTIGADPVHRPLRDSWNGDKASPASLRRPSRPGEAEREEPQLARGVRSRPHEACL